MRNRHTHASIRFRPGFSLIELLLAIFILSIGVIAVAALLPAGIYQQRQAVDDVIGPVVANNAMAMLRSRLTPDDFGLDGLFDPRSGDWPWRRPGFVTRDPVNDVTVGSIFIFTNSLFAPFATEPPGNRIPHNVERYGVEFGPAVMITQEERYFPVSGRELAPTYMWECMFRRHEGRVQVAIFVYRVIDSSGGVQPYRVAENLSFPDLAPLPISVNLTLGGLTGWNSYGVNPDRPEDVTFVADTEVGSVFDPADDSFAWQLPGQWILDQHGGVHRVVSGRRQDEDGPVELRQPVPPRLSPNRGGTSFFDPSAIHNPADPTIGPDFINEGVVSRIWFLPEYDSQGRRLVPIYVTVQEL